MIMKTLRLERAKQFIMVEKTNHLAVHVIFMSRETGEQFIRDTVPGYVARGIYMDKTLSADSFEIIER